MVSFGGGEEEWSNHYVRCVLTVYANFVLLVISDHTNHTMHKNPIFFNLKLIWRIECRQDVGSDRKANKNSKYRFFSLKKDVSSPVHNVLWFLRCFCLCLINHTKHFNFILGTSTSQYLISDMQKMDNKSTNLQNLVLGSIIILYTKPYFSKNISSQNTTIAGERDLVEVLHEMVV